MMVTLCLHGKIKLVMISFYTNDAAVDEFVETFNNNLKNGNILVANEKIGTIAGLIDFFKECPVRYRDYTCLMIVTHGTENEGNPTFQETQDDPGPLDQLVESWNFMQNILHNAVAERLVVLACCYAGENQIANLLQRFQPLALHVLTPFPSQPLEVSAGAKALALYFDILADMNLNEYSPDHLEDALNQVEFTYPGILKLHLYGED